MTFQIIKTKHCKWDNQVINLCARRGNGKQSDFCDSSCNRKMYKFKKIFDNIMRQLELTHELPETGELSKEVLKFMVLLKEYLDLGLRADIIILYFEAMVDGKKCSTLESVFIKKTEIGRRLR